MRNKLFPFMFAAVTLGTLTACGAPGTAFGNPFSVPFTLTLQPSSVTLEPGGKTHVSVTAKSENTILPSPKVKSFGNSVITATPDDTGFDVQVAPNAQPGSYSFNVSASVRSGEGSTPFTVTVTKPVTEETKYEFAFNPQAVNIEQGQNLATTLHLRVNGKLVNAENITLNAPAGLTAERNQNGAIVYVASSAIPGVYTVVAQTEVNGKPLQATLTVTVTSAKTN